MRIVLIDDAPVGRELFARIARRAGHDVAIRDSFDIERLVRDVVASSPDLVVVDGRFADRLGVGVAEPRCAALVARLRDAIPDASIAIVAAFDERGLGANAAALGVRYRIARPYVASYLRSTLSTIASERGGASEA